MQATSFWRALTYSYFGSQMLPATALKSAYIA